MRQFSNNFKMDSGYFAVQNSGMTNRRCGVVILPSVLILGVIIVGIGLTGIFVVRLLNQANFDVRLGAEATAAATAGIEDANLRLLQGVITVNNTDTIDNDCDDSGDFSSETYTLPQLGGRVNTSVRVCQTEPNCLTSVDSCQFKVLAESSGSFFVKRRVKGVFDKDGVTGEMRLISIDSVEF